MIKEVQEQAILLRAPINLHPTEAARLTGEERSDNRDYTTIVVDDLALTLSDS